MPFDSRFGTAAASDGGHMKKAKPRKRLPAAERKQIIALSAAKLFARLGASGTTTKEIAEAAGISEGLLFKYFPTKDDLTAAALEACRQNVIPVRIAEALAQPPSTAALVNLMVVLAEQIEFTTAAPEREDRDTINRMLLRSLCEDGKFARIMLQDVEKRTVAYAAACLESARAAGEAEGSADEPPALLSWFGHQLAWGVMACQLPSRLPMLDKYDRATQLKAMVRFRLRGLGVTSKALHRYLDRRSK
jgi:AcrR family transcriptional regulator